MSLGTVLGPLLSAQFLGASSAYLKALHTNCVPKTSKFILSLPSPKLQIHIYNCLLDFFLLISISSSTYLKKLLTYPSNSFLHLSKWHSILLATPTVLVMSCIPPPLLHIPYLTHSRILLVPLQNTSIVWLLHTTSIAVILAWTEMMSIILLQFLSIPHHPGLFFTQLPEWCFQTVHQKITFFPLIL